MCVLKRVSCLQHSMSETSEYFDAKRRERNLECTKSFPLTPLSLSSSPLAPPPLSLSSSPLAPPLSLPRVHNKAFTVVGRRRGLISGCLMRMQWSGKFKKGPFRSTYIPSLLPPPPQHGFYLFRGMKLSLNFCEKSVYEYTTHSEEPLPIWLRG